MDSLDRIVEQWRTERPDLNPAPMATLGRVARLYAISSRRLDAVFARHGLQSGDFDVLASLRRAGEPHRLAPTELARQLMLSKAGMTARVDRLEREGLISRHSGESDGRRRSVQLTGDGLALVDEVVVDHLAAENELLAGLSGSQRTQLDGLLRTLLGSLEAGEN